MTIKQLTIFVENKKGGLAEITDILAGGGVDMQAMSIAETKDFGLLRIIVNDAERALKILKSHDVLVKITEVLGVQIPNQPGSLANVLNLLSNSDINIEYLYAFLSNVGENANVVLRVSDNYKATEILTEAGYKASY